MKLLLNGHDYKYAAEQIMLHMYPAEKPEFTDTLPDTGLCAEIKITRGAAYVTAAVTIYDGTEKYKATARVLCDANITGDPRGKLERRVLQKAFFKAACLAGQTDVPWGAAAGIRPATLVTKMISAGMSEKKAARTFSKEYGVSAERVLLAVDCARAEIEARNAFGTNDVALYIGIPFCPTRCAYCSFVSNSVEKSGALVAPFLDALHREIDALGEILRNLEKPVNISCVYIGGGTPTTLSAAQLDGLMTRMETVFDLPRTLEYTAEAGRPDTIDAEKLEVLRLHKVTRVSVNPQTFDDNVLRNIGRQHTSGGAVHAFQLARNAGFKSINMDIIAGLPSDTFEGFTKSVDTAISLCPENITVHALSRKKGSRVTVENLETPDGGEAARMIAYSVSVLRENGYAPYYLYRQKYSSGGLENTGWTKPGHSGLYNIAMMDEALTVLALGGGGVTKLVSKNNRIERIFNAKYPYEYIQRIEQTISRKSVIREFLLAENNCG